MQFSYPDFRTYGNPPYKVVLVHGGPGAPGEMEPVARHLAQKFGILEPLQKESSVEGQINELARILVENTLSPVILVGWSWGAHLSFMFAARFPLVVEKLILISSAPFTAEFAKDIMKTRLARVPKDKKIELEKLAAQLNDKEKLKEFARILFRAETYNPIVQESHPLDYQYALYEKVWNEAKNLRSNGTLLEYARLVTCPVVAIHGDYDPHPFQGVQDPLSPLLNAFTFHLIKKCGHYPWYEKEAEPAFYKVLEYELQ